MRGIWLTLALVLTSTSALAKSHFLPDYQGAGLNSREQEVDNKTTTNTCSTYGLYSSTQSNMVCSATHPTVGLTCYSCQSCGSEYQYTTVECPTSTYTLSEQCGGKYKNCSCNTALYPTTSTTTGCPSGQVPDTSKYCEDKPSGTKHYACANVNCNSENITVDECKAKGNNCTASKEANCTDYCDTNGCQDNCTYLEQTGQARSDCQYGCATGKDVSGCTDLCYECDAAPEPPTDTCADIYDGKSNTAAIIKQLGADALAATAANQYYVGDKNGDFGQGKWYLPSIGELVDMYGTNPNQITAGSGATGASGSYMERINNALGYLESTNYDKSLYKNGVDAQSLSYYYWSSSESSLNSVWQFTVSSPSRNGYRDDISKGFSGSNHHVRPFLELESCFNTSAKLPPRVGQVMYADKTWSNAENYDDGSSNRPVGIIASVNKTDGSVKIVSLKDLTFSSTNSSGNFDADNPYGGEYDYVAWATSGKKNVDITDVPNYDADRLGNMLKKCTTTEEEDPCPDAVSVYPGWETCTSYCSADASVCIEKRAYTCDEAIANAYGIKLSDSSTEITAHKNYYLTKDVSFTGYVSALTHVTFYPASKLRACRDSVVYEPKLTFADVGKLESDVGFYVDTDISSVGVETPARPTINIGAEVRIAKLHRVLVTPYPNASSGTVSFNLKSGLYDDKAVSLIVGFKCENSAFDNSIYAVSSKAKQCNASFSGISNTPVSYCDYNEYNASNVISCGIGSCKQISNCSF